MPQRDDSAVQRRQEQRANLSLEQRMLLLENDADWTYVTISKALSNIQESYDDLNKSMQAVTESVQQLPMQHSDLRTQIMADLRREQTSLRASMIEEFERRYMTKKHHWVGMGIGMAVSFGGGLLAFNGLFGG
jgi:hypothetical protein